jgi:SSS family transporter
VRTLASVIFLLWRFGWMSIALYVPALVVSQTTGLPYVPTVIFLGGMVTLYTMLGGITAIIWTDVLQFCIMLLGVVVTVIVAVGKVDGGVAGVFDYAAAHGGMRLVASPPEGADLWGQLGFLFTNETSVIGIMLAPIIGRMTMYTCEQSMIQRFKATRSVEDSRRAFIVNAAGDAVWSIGLAFVGLTLFAFYAASIGDRGRLPEGIQDDTLTTYFMRKEFPTGLNGLVVAAVLASGLSAIDAAISASTSVVMVDFYNRLFLKRTTSSELTDAESRAEVKTSRIVTVMVAAVGILAAANVPALGKNIIQLMNTVIQTFTGPLFALFLLGMFSERARGGPVLLGGCVGTLVALYLSQTKLWGELLGRLLGHDPIDLPGSGIGFVWPAVFGGVTVWLVGYLASVLLPGQPSEKQKAMTWRNVVRRPVVEEDELQK